jgi:hypothetical protein
MNGGEFRPQVMWALTNAGGYICCVERTRRACIAWALEGMRGTWKFNKKKYAWRVWPVIVKSQAAARSAKGGER